MTTRARIGQAVTGLALAVAGVVLLVELAGPVRIPVSDPLGPHGVPRVLAGGLVVAGVLLLATAWWRRRPVPPEPAEPGDPPLEQEPAAGDPPPEVAAPGPGRLPIWLVTALTVVATGGYVEALSRLGFVLATVLLGLLLLPLLGTRRWYTVLAVPAGLTAVLWFLFGYVLDIGLPGFLGRL